MNGKLYLFGESVDLWIYDPGKMETISNLTF